MAVTPRSRASSRLLLAHAAALLVGLLPVATAAQAPGGGRPPAKSPAATGPSLSAPRSVMAGAVITVFVSRMPAGAQLAIARADDPPEIVIARMLSGSGTPLLPAPGLPGTYELRLLAMQEGKQVVLLRQPITTTQASATLAAPERVKAGAAFPARGIGPNGQFDRIVLVRPGSPPAAEGPFFRPAENVEATLEAPAEPGAYELRYVTHAPLIDQRVLASRPLRVE